MREKLQRLLRERSNSPDIAVFFAGSDPLSPETQFLIDWLSQRNAIFSVVDALRDPLLSPLLEAECATRFLPILAVNGHLIGNGPLLQQLAESGQLSRIIEDPPVAQTPVIAVSRQAISKLRSELQVSDVVRLTITSDFMHELGLSEVRPDDMQLQVDDVTLVVDPISATRANGVGIDWIELDECSGFRIDNPNSKPVSCGINCDALVQLMEGPNPPLLIDARTDREFNDERIPGARLLDGGLLDALQLLDRRISLVFYCKNGTRSQRAAQHCRELGFADVVTLNGGMDAWKSHVSP